VFADRLLPPRSPLFRHPSPFAVDNNSSFAKF
jgi:hypothetical protein